MSLLTRAMLWVCSNNRLQQKSCFLYIPTQSIYTMWRTIIWNKVEKNYTKTFTGRRESITSYHWGAKERSFLLPHFHVSSCVLLVHTSAFHNIPQMESLLTGCSKRYLPVKISCLLGADFTSLWGGAKRISPIHW